MPGPTEVDGPHGATVAPLPERIDALNYSLDPSKAYGRCATRLGDSPPTGNGADPGLYPTAATHRGVSSSLRRR